MAGAHHMYQSPMAGQQRMSASGQSQYGGSTMTSPTKEVNTATCCRLGQDTVQEIVQKTIDILQHLKMMQVPNGQSSNYDERKPKLDESLKHVQLNFKKLRAIYKKVQDDTAAFSHLPAEELVPIEGEPAQQDVKPVTSDASRMATEEHRDIAELVEAKNRQLKTIIDQLRTVIWEINTMLSMRHI